MVYIPKFEGRIQSVTYGDTLQPITVRLVEYWDEYDTIPADVPITISLYRSPDGAVLGGTTTKMAVDGVAVFDDLTLSKPGVPYVLMASLDDTQIQFKGIKIDEHTVALWKFDSLDDMICVDELGRYDLVASGGVLSPRSPDQELVASPDDVEVTGTLDEELDTLLRSGSFSIYSQYQHPYEEAEHVLFEAWNGPYLRLKWYISEFGIVCLDYTDSNGDVQTVVGNWSASWNTNLVLVFLRGEDGKYTIKFNDGSVPYPYDDIEVRATGVELFGGVDPSGTTMRLYIPSGCAVGNLVIWDRAITTADFRDAVTRMGS